MRRPVDVRLVSARGSRPLSEREPASNGESPSGKLNWRLTVTKSAKGRLRVDDTIEPSEPGALSREFMRQAAQDARFFARVRTMRAKAATTIQHPTLVRITSAPSVIPTVSDAGEPRKDIEPPRQSPERPRYSTRGRKLPAAMGAVLREQLAALPVGSAIKHYAALPAGRPTLFRVKIKD